MPSYSDGDSALKLLSHATTKISRRQSNLSCLVPQVPTIWQTDNFKVMHRISIEFSGLVIQQFSGSICLELNTVHNISCSVKLKSKIPTLPNNNKILLWILGIR